MIKRPLVLCLALLLVLVLYLLFAPVSLEPQAFQPPSAPPLTGVFAINDRLAEVERLAEGVGFAPEEVAFDAAGFMYAGMEDGRIMRLSADGQDVSTFAHTNGRPLGMAHDSIGNLIVADAVRGLLSVSPGGQVTVLTNEAEGKPIMLADDLAIAANGMIYFSDASIYPLTDHLRMELLDGRPHGRLLAYDPNARTTRLLLDSLYFANGVTLGPHEDCVLVTETGAYRVTRYWLAGPQKGRRDHFIENLPGFPDNISWNEKDTYWLALASPRKPLVEMLQSHPFLRKIILRLPPPWIPTPHATPHGFVLGFDVNGQVIHNLQDPSGKYAVQVTSVLEHDGVLYLGTIGDNAIKRLSLP
jgi:sugar lactone lactonase YvrE